MVRLLVLLLLGSLGYQVFKAWKLGQVGRAREEEARKQRASQYAGKKAVDAEFEEIEE